MKINVEDWIPQVQDNLKREFEIESLPPPLPPKMIQTSTPSHRNAGYGPGPSAVVVMESELNPAPALPPKPAARPLEK